MAGTISSLGIGSGILTNDLLTKLRTGEETARLTPVDTSLTTIKTKQAALSTLMIDLANVKDKAADLSDSMHYLKRTATSTSTDVAITADSGVRAQSIGIKVTQLAQNDVYQSKGVKTEDAIPSSTDFEITIKIGETTKKISITGGSSLSAIADKINSESDGKYGASILNTGMGDTPYRLILKSKEQGTDNALVISDTGPGLFAPKATGANAVTTTESSSLTGNDLVINGRPVVFTYTAGSSSYNDQLAAAINNVTADKTVGTETLKGSSVTASIVDGKLVLSSVTNDDIKITTTVIGATVTGLTSGAVTDEVVAKSRLQKAQNSLFEYNGVNMSRSSNTVDDIVVGMKLTFNKVMDTTATLDIKQDTSSIVTSFKNFVTNYNTLSAKITELTKYDTDNKKAATFTGQNEITSILSKLNTFLTRQNEDGISLTDMGLSRNEDGTITFNDATLTTKLQEDPQSAEKVLRGSTTYKAAVYKSATTPSTSLTKLESSGLMINNVYIKFHDFTKTTSQERAQEIAEYLNTYKNETGVTASVDAATNKLVLTDPMGGEINVTASENASKLLGLGATKITNQRLAIGSSTQVNGFFADISDVMKTLMVGSNSSLKLFEAGLQKELTNATKNRASIADQINTRFELMANQFAAYDSVINKYNLMGQQVTAAINALSNG